MTKTLFDAPAAGPAEIRVGDVRVAQVHQFVGHEHDADGDQWVVFWGCGYQPEYVRLNFLAHGWNADAFHPDGPQIYRSSYLVAEAAKFPTRGAAIAAYVEGYKPSIRKALRKQLEGASLTATYQATEGPKNWEI